MSQTASYNFIQFPMGRTCNHLDLLNPIPLKRNFLLLKTNKKSRAACSSRPMRHSTLCRLPSLSATLAAIAVLTTKPGDSIASVENNAITTQSQTQLLDSLSQHDDRHLRASETPEGTLVRVHPSGTKDVHSETGEVLQSKNATRNSPGHYPHITVGLQGWGRTRLQRTMRASRPGRIVRVRPTTLGLVGVGAFTSGSVFLRSLTRHKTRSRDDSFLSTRDVCSVVSMQIPFCVSERSDMLQTFAELAKTSSITAPEGMAKASRAAATILLEEKGLLEDSTKFAPYIDVFLAENLACAEKRFSGHVATEESRLQKIESSLAEKKSAEQRLYGVVTMVVATMEGVDLECYDEHSSLVSRLRHALDSVSKLRGGDVAGLELIWVPETLKDGPLTRTQISDAYPWLKVG